MDKADETEWKNLISCDTQKNPNQRNQLFTDI